MDAKEFLREVRKIDLEIRNKLVEKQQWKDLALRITAAMEGERVRTSGSPSKMADAIDRCVDVEAEIDALVDRLVQTKKQVVQIIEGLDSPIEYDVLHRRYIQFLSLQEIADHYGRDYGWATTTHGRAVKNVQGILDGTGGR